MTIVRRIVESFVWFFGGLLGIESILSVPEHDIKAIRQTLALLIQHSAGTDRFGLTHARTATLEDDFL